MIKIKTFYIQEDDKPNKIKEFFSLIKIEKDTIIVPKDLKDLKIEKIAKKIKKTCKKNNVHNIAISKKLWENTRFIDLLQGCDINIFDGRWLMLYMTQEVLDFVMKKNNKKKQETEISILTNNSNKEVIENIKIIAKEFKRVNIITNHIEEFKLLEENLYNKYGIMVILTNNKRKSLANAQIILNYDFVKERLNKYNVYENAIIINMEGYMKINKKRFNGVNVIDYEIKSKKAEDLFELEKMNKYYLKDIVEAEIYRKDSFLNIRKDITKGLFEIKELYGNNGALWKND